jgi:hypothetical protein
MKFIFGPKLSFLLHFPTFGEVMLSHFGVIINTLAKLKVPFLSLVNFMDNFIICDF